MPTWFSSTRSYSTRLVQFFSQTDTPSEKNFAPYLQQILMEWPYFQAHPDQLWLERTLADPLERYVVMALVRGNGPATMILTGHFDVVAIENYGDLAPYACEPDDLLPRLIHQLQLEANSDIGLSPADRLALEDFRSGEYLPGRGMLDMKSGLAAGMVVLQRYSELPLAERPGNLLFVAVPDEEIASHGACAAALRLPDISARWNLQPAAAINLDASDDHGDGTFGQSAYLGSVGKLLPAVYLVGRETHAGSPFSGINANWLAAELTRRLECDPLLVDSIEGQFTPPPTCLKQADTKPHYDVTTPISAWCYYNWQMVCQPVEQVIERMSQIAGQTLEAVRQESIRRAGLFAQQSGQPVLTPDWQPQVFTFAQLRQLAVQRGGAAVEQRLDEIEQRLAADSSLDATQVSLAVVEAAWAASGLIGPAAVVGIASRYYPPVIVDGSTPRSAKFKAAIERQAAALSQELRTPINVRPFFPGISDISFLGGHVSAANLAALASNSPAWNQRTGFDYAATAQLNLPSVNIGPWGRDYHQRTERVQMPYSFDVLPELLWRICQDWFGQPGE